jgi:hypothetical protein
MEEEVGPLVRPSSWALGCGASASVRVACDKLPGELSKSMIATPSAPSAASPLPVAVAPQVSRGIIGLAYKSLRILAVGPFRLDYVVTALNYQLTVPAFARNIATISDRFSLCFKATHRLPASLGMQGPNIALSIDEKPQCLHGYLFSANVLVNECVRDPGGSVPCPKRTREGRRGTTNPDEEFSTHRGFGHDALLTVYIAALASKWKLRTLKPFYLRGSAEFGFRIHATGAERAIE